MVIDALLTGQLNVEHLVPEHRFHATFRRASHSVSVFLCNSTAFDKEEGVQSSSSVIVMEYPFSAFPLQSEYVCFVQQPAGHPSNVDTSQN
jgi:hypothetical protein